MLQNQDWDIAKKHGRLVAKAWADPAFKERLAADPAAVLREHGFDVPGGIEVRLVEQADGTVAYDDGVIRFAMPTPPSREFEDESLDGDVLQAGGCSAHTSSSGPHTSSSGGGCIGCIVSDLPVPNPTLRGRAG